MINALIIIIACASLVSLLTASHYNLSLACALTYHTIIHHLMPIYHTIYYGSPRPRAMIIPSFAYCSNNNHNIIESFQPSINHHTPYDDHMPLISCGPCYFIMSPYFIIRLTKKIKTDSFLTLQ